MSRKSLFKKSVFLLAFFSVLAVFSVSCQFGLGNAVDTVAPTITITYPPVSAVIRDKFTLYGTWTDDKGVTQVKVNVINTATKETVLQDAKAQIDSTNKTWQIDLNSYDSSNSSYYNGWQFADGTYQVSVIASDASSHSSSEVSRTFDIDNTAPVFIISNPGVVKNSTSTASAYGSIFTVDGTIADDHSISSMDVIIYNSEGTVVSKESYNGEEISSFHEDDIQTAGGTSVTIAQYGSSDNRYSLLYNQNDGTEYFTCSIKLTDNAQIYQNPTNSSRSATQEKSEKIGNSTYTLYLYDDVYTSLMSSKKGLSLSATDLKNIINKTYTSDSSKKESAESVLEKVAINTQSQNDSTNLYFSLNPKANPSYQVNGFIYDFDESGTLPQASSGNTLSVTVSQGLDGTKIDLDGSDDSNSTVKVWFKEYESRPSNSSSTYTQASVLNELSTLATNVLAAENEEKSFIEYKNSTSENPTTEFDSWKLIYDYAQNSSGGESSVSSKTFSVTLPTNSVKLGKYYIIAVTGSDVDGVSFLQDTVYGFEGNEAGVAPTLQFNSPANAALVKSSDFEFSGTAKLESGSLYISELKATLTVTDQSDNSTIGTYVQDLTRESSSASLKPNSSSASQSTEVFYWQNGDWKFNPSKLPDYNTIKAAEGSGKSYVYTLALYGKSSSGHGANLSSYVQIDSTLPVVNLSSITPTVNGSEYNSSENTYVNGTITVKGTVEETNLSTVSMQVYVDGTAVSIFDDGNGGTTNTLNLGKVYSFSQSIDTTKLNNSKSLDIRITATDLVGNSATYSSLSASDSEYKKLVILQETDKPIITLGNSSNTSTNATLTDGTKTYDFVTDSTKISEANGNLFGTTSNNKLTATISDDDTIALVEVYIYDSNGNLLDSDKVYDAYGANPFTASPKKSSYNLTYYLPQEEGTYKICINAYDYDSAVSTNAYGKGSTGEYFIAISKGAPSINLNTVNKYQTSTPTFSGSVSSSLASLSAVFIDVDSETELSSQPANVKFNLDSSARTWTASLEENQSLSNGTYKILFKASNSYGQSGTSSASFTVDNESPTLSITNYGSSSVADGLTSNADFYVIPSNNYTIKGTVSDNLSGIDSVYFYIGDFSEKPTLTSANNWKSASLGDGTWTASLTSDDLSALSKTDGSTSYTFHVLALDSAGNLSDCKDLIKIYPDSVAPSTTIKSTNLYNSSGIAIESSTDLTDGETYFAKKAFTLSGEITENNLSSVKFAGTDITSKISNNAWKYSPNVSYDGTFTYKISLTDKAGNLTEKTIYVLYDTTSPSLTISSPSQDQNVSDGKVTVSGTVNDSGSGIKTVSYKAEISYIENGETKTASFDRSKDVSENGNFSFDEKSLGAEGTCKLTLTATDILGNSKSSNEITFYYDKTGPELLAEITSTPIGTKTVTVNGTSTEYTVYSSSSLSVKATAKDSISGVSSVVANGSTKLSAKESATDTYEGTVLASLADDGSTSITILASDKFANTTTYKIENIMVDVSSPSVSITTKPSEDKTLNSAFTLSGTVSDDVALSDTDTVIVTDSLDGTKYTAAVDSSGSTNSGTWSVTLTPKATSSASEFYTKDGSHTYTVKATDKAGNTSETSCKVKTDVTKPYWYTDSKKGELPYIKNSGTSVDFSTGSTTETRTYYKSNSLTITAKAKDDTSDVSIYYNLNGETSDGKQVWTDVGNANFTYDSFVEGANTLRIKAVDDAENETETQATITFYVDTKSPSAATLTSLDDITDATTLENYNTETGSSKKLVNATSDLNFTLTLQDDNSVDATTYSGIASAAITKIGSTTTSISGTVDESDSSKYSFTISADELKSIGTGGAVTVKVLDKAGNSADFTVFNILVDKDAPSLTLASPSDADNSSSDKIDVNKTISLSGTATDTNELDSSTIVLEYNETSATASDGWLTLTSDSANLDTSKYKFAGSSFAITQSSSFSVSGLDTSKFTDKSSIYLRATAKDMAGNQGYSSVITLYVNQDSDRPIVKISNITQQSDGSFILKYGTNAQVTGTISDDDSVSSAVIKNLVISESAYNGTGTQPTNLASFTSTTGDFTFTPSDTTDGEKSFYIYIEDNNGGVFYTTATTTAVSGETQYLSNPKLYLQTTQLSDSKYATSKITYKSDSNPPSVSNAQSYTYNSEGTKNTTISGSTTVDILETVGASFIVGGTEKSKLQFVITASDDNGIAGITLELTKTLSGETSTIAKYATSSTINGTSFSDYTVSSSSFNQTSNKTNSVWTTEQIDISDWESATVTLKATAYDNSGLYGSGSYSFVVDKSAPTIKISSPSSSEEVTGDVTVSGTATDSGGSATKNVYWFVPTQSQITSASSQSDAQVYWRDLILTAAKDSSNTRVGNKLDKSSSVNVWSFIFGSSGSATALTNFDDTDFQSSGLYNIPLYIMAEDELGNYAVETSYTVKHNPDGDKPVTTITYPDSKETTLGGTIRLSGTVTIPSASTTASALFIQIDSSSSFTKDYIEGLKDSSEKQIYTVYSAADAISEVTGKTETVKSSDYASYGFSSETDFTSWWGIKANKSSSSLWTRNINSNGEFNPETSGTTKTIYLRASGINANGKIGEWTNTYTVNVDNSAPSISPTLEQFSSIKQTATSTDGSSATVTAIKSASKVYNANMYLKGSWYIVAKLLDETGVNKITVSYKGTSTSKSYNILKTENSTSTLDIPSGYFIQKIDSEVESGTTKKGYTIYIPVLQDIGDTVTYTIEVMDSDGSAHTSKAEFVLNIDNTAPKIESVSGNGDTLISSGTTTYSVSNRYNVQEKNYVFSPSGKVEDNGSGYERVLFQFVRGENDILEGSSKVVIDPMIVNSDSSDYSAAKATITGSADSTTNGEVFAKTLTQDSNTYSLYGKNVSGTLSETLIGTSSSANTFTASTSGDISSDTHIRAYGIIYVDGLYRKITGISGDVITFDPELPSLPTDTSVTAFFPYAQVVDNTSTEKVTSESANPITLSSDDGDGMPESITKLSTTWSWDATIHSTNMPDGPATLIVLAFDVAGNVSGVEIPVMIANNAPRLAKVWLGTDFDSNDKFTDNEFEEYSLIGKDATEGLEEATKDLNNEFTAKNKLAVVTEFTGGNGEVKMAYLRDSSSTSAVTSSAASGFVEADSSVTASSTFTTQFASSSVKAYVLSNANLTGSSSDSDVTESTDGEDKNFSFTFWDSTDETICGTNSQNARLALKNMKFDLVDGTKPLVRVNSFYWASSSNNSLYGNSTSNGHIELEDDLPNGTFTSDNSGEYDRDPKVSGKIVFTGTAYDEHALSKITATYGSLNAQATYDKSAKTWTGSGTLGETSDTSGYKFTVYDAAPSSVYYDTDTAYFDQNGHKVYWTLAVDTENSSIISATAASDQKLTVVATDSSSNSTSTSSADEVTTTAESATVYEVDASYNKPTYQTDVVPYIAGISTSLSSLKTNNPSVYNRTALGHYPVSTSESVTITGFNLKGATISDSATTANTVKLADSGSAISVANFTSGKIKAIVNGISSLNNENSNDSKGAYEGTVASDKTTGDATIYANYYNRQPNGDSNNLLTDDVVLDVWSFDSDAATVKQAGYIVEPIMKINPINGAIGFAFNNGPAYFSMANGTSTSFSLWQRNYARNTTTGFAIDSNGVSHGITVGLDTNPNSGHAGRMTYMTSDWGIGTINGEGGNYDGYHTSRIESIGVPAGTYNDITYTDKIYLEERFSSPSLTTSVHSDGTYVYLAYYDDLNQQIRFRWGNLNNATANDTWSQKGYSFNQFADQTNNDVGVSNNTVFESKESNYSVPASSKVEYATGKTAYAGEFVSIDVISGSSSTNDVVVMAWYDSKNSCLWYSYKKSPCNDNDMSTTHSDGYWSKPIMIMDDAGENCKIAVDITGGIHIAAYDVNNADLIYAYLPSYSSTTPKVCTVDSYSLTGTNITLDVAISGDYVVPYIGYYMISSGKPKIAYLDNVISVTKTNSSSYSGGYSGEIPNGSDSDAFTGAWEVSMIPTESRMRDDYVNIGLWKNSLGEKVAATDLYSDYASKSTYQSGDTGYCYGNGTSNPVMGYAIRVGTTGYIETAQMQ